MLITWTIDELVAGGALLNLILSCEELLVRSLKAGDSLDCCYHEIVELRILRGGKRQKQDHNPGNVSVQVPLGRIYQRTG